MIVSTSLHHSNIAFLFEERSFVLPENADLAALYKGDEAKGARLVDDPVMRAKVLTLPTIPLRITAEHSRVRIDDESGRELAESRLARDARHIYEGLFSKAPLTAWGINMDLYVRTQNVVPLRDIFGAYFSPDALSGADLMDTGIQFTLRRNKFTEVWFIKVTAPLEMAIHVNRHFEGVPFPDQKGLEEVLAKCYTETGTMLSHFVYG